MSVASIELAYEELIAPNRLAGKIIEPHEIPVHPTVYQAASVYTPEFAEQVTQSLFDSIRKDVATIERIMRTNLRLEVTDEAIVQDGDELLFEDFTVRANPKAKFVEVCRVSSNIALDTRVGYQTKFRPSATHPMSIDKLRAYGFNPEQPDIRLPTWYIHNLSLAGFGGFLIYRNFAIMFNNLGLRKVGLATPIPKPE